MDSWEESIREAWKHWMRRELGRRALALSALAEALPDGYRIVQVLDTEDRDPKTGLCAWSAGVMTEAQYRKLYPNASEQDWPPLAQDRCDDGQ